MCGNSGVDTKERYVKYLILGIFSSMLSLYKSKNKITQIVANKNFLIVTIGNLFGIIKSDEDLTKPF